MHRSQHQFISFGTSANLLKSPRVSEIQCSHSLINHGCKNQGKNSCPTKYPWKRMILSNLNLTF